MSKLSEIVQIASLVSKIGEIVKIVKNCQKLSNCKILSKIWHIVIIVKNCKINCQNCQRLLRSSKVKSLWGCSLKVFVCQKVKVPGSWRLSHGSWRLSHGSWRLSQQGSGLELPGQLKRSLPTAVTRRNEYFADTM